MKFRLIPSIIVAITLCIVMSKIVYFGFTPKYGPIIFSKQAYHNMFDHDVFKYRILSQYLLLTLDDWLNRHIAPPTTRLPIPYKIERNSTWFYYSFYYLNTIFLCLTSIVLVFLLRLKQAFQLNDSEKHQMLFLSILVISFSQFVISPYDITGYFFQLLILYIFIAFFERDTFFSLFSIAALVFLSTLNRESSALSVALIALLIYLKQGRSFKSILHISLLVSIFIGTYTALRYIITDPSNQKFTYFDAGRLFVNTNVIGLLFWTLFTYFTASIANTKENRWLILIYNLICLPYITICFIDGVLWEVRLYIPLFLGSIFMGKLNTSTCKIHFTGIIKSHKILFKKNSSSKTIAT